MTKSFLIACVHAALQIVALITKCKRNVSDCEMVVSGGIVQVGYIHFW